MAELSVHRVPWHSQELSTVGEDSESHSRADDNFVRAKLFNRIYFDATKQAITA